MKTNYLLKILLLFISFGGYAQSTWSRTAETIYIDRDICTYYPAQIPHKSFIDIRQSAKNRIANKIAPCSNFIVSYNGFTSNAETAFQYAVDIWENLLDSPIPIRVNANFGVLDPGTLGSAGANGFLGLTDGVTTEFYTRALAEALLNTETTDTFADPDENPSTDIIASFSSTANFYFGTDGNTPPGQIDFVTVVLHELGHGLGVFGFAEVDDPDNPTVGGIRSNGGSGFPSIWDRFIENGANTSILSFTDPSSDLLDEFTSNDLFCNSPEAIAQNGEEPKIYAPVTFAEGSSYSHWDESTFPAGNIESLMTPFLAQGEAIHDPGNAMLGFMQDMGWVICDNRLNSNSLSIKNFKVSPNPFVNELTINLSNNLRNDQFSAQIVDINGRLIFESNIENSNGTIVLRDLNTLIPSLYFLTLTSRSSGQSITQKVIKN